MSESRRLRALIDRARLSREIAPFGRSDARKGAWQLVNTIVPYLGLLSLMVYGRLHGWHWAWTLLLALPTAALMIRIFIFFHDCCHDSFFGSRTANRITGWVTGILTFTPFDDWKQSHQRHHTTAGDLDNRGTGDVWTMTVDEYLAASRRKRLGYRLVRNPFFLLLVVPFYLSLIAYRIPRRGAGRAAAASVLLTDLALLAIAVVASRTIGLGNYLLVQLPVIVISWTSGVWLFYVQHQFEEAYWERGQQWDYATAAITGSSHLRLPGWMNWFTGHIGLHHVHHLGPKIPNYRLKRAHEENPIFTEAPVLTFWTAWRSLRLTLWDEANKRMIGFRDLRRMQRHAAPQAG